MTSENIFTALEGLDPELVLKAEPKENRGKIKKKAITWSLIAASVSLVLCASLIITSLRNQRIYFDASAGFIAFSYDTMAYKPTLPIFVTATFPTYMKTDENGGELKVPVGIGTIVDYSEERENEPLFSIIRIETDGITVDGESFVYERRIDITDPEFKGKNQIGDKVYRYVLPNHYEYHYFDLSELQNRDSGVIEIKLANHYGEDDQEWVAAHIYYAVKGDIVAFSRDGAESAEREAEKAYSREYSLFDCFFD